MLSASRRRVALVSAAAALLGGLLTPGAALARRASSQTSSSAAQFTNYPAPAGFSSGAVDDAGEPSIGVDWKTGEVMYEASVATLRVHFDDSASPATATWNDVTPPLTTTTADPILFTDSALGRTYASQLLTACSQMSVTTDDGANWAPSQGCGLVTLLDHQTVGAGPYTPGSSAAATAPGGHAVYYCAQYALSANCARSDDGGTTFGAGIPIYNVSNPGDNCAGLHGHLKVAPDGTVYVPNFDCNGKQAVTASTDNGMSWQVRPIPKSSTQDESDPSLGIATDGTLYFGYASDEGHGATDPATGLYTGDSHPMISISHDSGIHWSDPYDVGAALGIKNVQFPEVVAGDGDRAAFAFLGTKTGGNDQQGGDGSTPMFPGVWHLYVSTTYDGGATWATVDATPSDPVQKGCIWLQGGSSSCRNLLDFNDMTIDRQGRIVIAYADGCLDGWCPTDDSDRPALATIARQSSGLGLLAAFDPAGSGATKAPKVTSHSR